MINIRYALLASVFAIALSTLASAQSGGNPAAPAASTAPASAAAELVEAEVRKVDKESKKLTLKHGHLKSLDMPGMTMVFQVKEDTMLDKVQPGDKVRFQAEKIDGKFTVTKLEVARTTQARWGRKFP